MSKTLRRRSTDKGRRTKRKVTKRKVTNKSKSRLRTKHRTRNNRLKKNNRLKGNHSFKTYNGGLGVVKDMGKFYIDAAFPYGRDPDETFDERYPHLHNIKKTAKKVGNVVRHPMQFARERRRTGLMLENQQRMANRLGVTLDELHVMQNNYHQELEYLINMRQELDIMQDAFEQSQNNYNQIIYNIQQTQEQNLDYQGEENLNDIYQEVVERRENLEHAKSNYDRHLEDMRSILVSPVIDEDDL